METISRGAVRGAASGIFFMTFFGIIWAITGIIGLQDRIYFSFLIPVLFIGILRYFIDYGGTKATQCTSSSEKDMRAGKNAR